MAISGYLLNILITTCQLLNNSDQKNRKISNINKITFGGGLSI